MTTDELIEPAPRYQQTTFGLYGNQLPIGVLAGKPLALHKAFAFGKWRWKEEKRIAARLSSPKGPGGHNGKITTTVLAETLTQWGDDDKFADKEFNARVYALESSFMEDVFYAWVALRIHALGHDLGIDATCQVPGCGIEWKWKGDLRSMALSVTDHIIEPEELKLLDPVEFGGKDWTRVVLAPALWRGMCNVSSPQQGGSAPVSATVGELALSSVRAFVNDDGQQVPMTPTLADEFSKRDIERLNSTLIDGRFPKVDAQLELTCPSGHVFVTPLTWAYDFFFGAASLPRT